MANCNHLAPFQQNYWLSPWGDAFNWGARASCPAWHCISHALWCITSLEFSQRFKCFSRLLMCSYSIARFFSVVPKVFLDLPNVLRVVSQTSKHFTRLFLCSYTTGKVVHSGSTVFLNTPRNSRSPAVLKFYPCSYSLTKFFLRILSVLSCVHKDLSVFVQHSSSTFWLFKCS